jgi:hypothetical protein
MLVMSDSIFSCVDKMFKDFNEVLSGMSDFPVNVFHKMSSVSCKSWCDYLIEKTKTGEVIWVKVADTCYITRSIPSLYVEYGIASESNNRKYNRLRLLYTKSDYPDYIRQENTFSVNSEELYKAICCQIESGEKCNTSERKTCKDCKCSTDDLPKDTHNQKDVNSLDMIKMRSLVHKLIQRTKEATIKWKRAKFVDNDALYCCNNLGRFRLLLKESELVFQELNISGEANSVYKIPGDICKPLWDIMIGKSDNVLDEVSRLLGSD